MSATPTFISPLQGCILFFAKNPARWAGLNYFGLSGLSFYSDVEQSLFALKGQLMPAQPVGLGTPKKRFASPEREK